MSKTIKTLLTLFLAVSVCTASYGQADRPAAAEKTATFVFLPGNDLFLLKGNETELERLYALVDEYRTEIAAGAMPVYVDGYCASLPTSKENLTTAFVRANRVKSELILSKGLTEANFITNNYARAYHNNKDMVVVTLRIPATKEPDAARLERERREQAERERLAQAERERLAAERAAAEREAAERAERERAEAERIARELASRGVGPIVMYNLSFADESVVLRDVFRYDTLIVGAPTYNGGIYPPAARLLDLIAARCVPQRNFGWFGSFCWAGAAVRGMGEFAQRMKWEPICDPVEMKQGFSSGCHDFCSRFADGVAERFRR